MTMEFYETTRIIDQNGDLYVIYECTVCKALLQTSDTDPICKECAYTPNIINSNDVPSEFENRIIAGDSIVNLTQLPDRCVDLIFTSPPYNFGLNYTDIDDKKDWDMYWKELYQILDQCARVLKHGGRFVINVQPLFSEYIPTHHIISNYLTNNGLLWKAEILWEKNTYNAKYTSWGSWKSPSSPYFKYTWEFLEVFCKGTMKHDGDDANIDITGDEFKNWTTGRWTIAPERYMGKFGHPSMFPEQLATRVLKLFSYKNDFILDPFAGAGTVPVVAKKNNRRYLGIDISRQYCDIAEKRINEILL